MYSDRQAVPGIGSDVHINLGPALDPERDGMVIRPAKVLGCDWRSEELYCNLLVFTPQGTRYMANVPKVPEYTQSLAYHWNWPPRFDCG